MTAETVQRRWTVATWLLAGVDDFEPVVHVLEPLSADAIALQSVHERDADTVAAALGMQLAWEVSHFPRSRVLLGSSVGLAVLTPHRVSASHAVVTSSKRSLWSTSRRIAQFCTVERHDQTGYTIVHAIGPTHGVITDAGGFPLVRLVPDQVGIDATRAVDLPAKATVLSSTTSHPLEGAHDIQATTFELPWVKGDFPVI